MLKGSIRGFPVIAKVLLLVGMFILVELLFSGIAIVLIQAVFPEADFYNFITSISEVRSADQITSVQLTALKVFQLITSVGRFIFVPFLFLFLNGQEFFSGLDLNKNIRITSVVLIILIMFTAPGVINIINEWNQNINLPSFLDGMERSMRESEDMAKVQTDAFLSTTTLSGLLLNIFIIGVIAAVGEEILFRGVLQNLFLQGTKNIHVAIWLSAFFFSFIHLQFFGFFPRMILGALLGYLYYWSGSLWSAIIAHFVNNAASVIAYYLLNKGMIEQNVTETASWPVAVITLPFLILFLIAFRRNQSNKLQPYGKRLDDDLLDS